MTSAARDRKSLLTHVIVAAISPSADSACWVLDRAFDESIRRQPSVLHLLVIGHDPDLKTCLRTLRSLVEVRLEAFRAQDEKSAWSIKLHARSGQVATQTTALAAETGADLICIGASTTIERDIPAAILASAGCPVLVVRPKEYSASSFPEPQVCEDCNAARRSFGDGNAYCEKHDHLPLSATLVPHAGIRASDTGLLL